MRNTAPASCMCEWDESQKAPVVEITSSVAAQDRSVDLGKPGKAAALSDADRKLYTGATALIPTDGIVKTTSDKIVGNAGSDLEKAQKIYDWVVENTFRNAKTRGCGVGDIAAMLTSRQSQRQMRRPECAVCRARARAGHSGARRLRHPRGALEVRLQESRRRVRDHHQGAALPRRSLSQRASAGCRSIPPTCAR